MRTRFPALGAFLLLSTAGCHTFTPAQRNSIQPGQAVRVTITPQEAADRVETLGSLRTTFEGTVRELDTTTLGLTMSSVATPVEARGRMFSSYVQLSWDGVTEVETKQFSLTRTGLLAAGGILATLLILDVTDDSGGQDGEPPPTNQGFSIPIFSFFR